MFYQVICHMCPSCITKWWWHPVRMNTARMVYIRWRATPPSAGSIQQGLHTLKDVSRNMCCDVGPLNFTLTPSLTDTHTHTHADTPLRHAHTTHIGSTHTPHTQAQKHTHMHTHTHTHTHAQKHTHTQTHIHTHTHLSRLCTPQDEVGRCQHGGVGQLELGFFIACGILHHRARQEPHPSLLAISHQPLHDSWHTQQIFVVTTFIEVLRGVWHTHNTDLLLLWHL